MSGDGLNEQRLERAERDIERLERRADRADDGLAELRRDLRADLAATEQRLNEKIRSSHQALAGALDKLDEHLTEQDKLIAAGAHNETQQLAARFDFPSLRTMGRTLLLTLATSAGGYSFAHFVLHVF